MLSLATLLMAGMPVAYPNETRTCITSAPPTVSLRILMYLVASLVCKELGNS